MKDTISPAQESRASENMRVRRVVFLVLTDIILINLAGFVALWTRFEFSISNVLSSNFLASWGILSGANTVLTLVIFKYLHLYSSLWEYAGVDELLRIVIGALGSTIVEVLGCFLLGRGLPRSFILLYPIFLSCFVGGIRLFYRWFRKIRHRSRNHQTRTLLIGAGEAGNIALREFQESVHSKNEVVCIIDDSQTKRGRVLRGVPIVGGRETIPAAVDKYNIEEIIFAIPTASAKERREIMTICQKTKCTIKTLPAIFQLANGEVSIQKIRNIQIEDLLGRDPVRVDMSGIADHIRGKTVLVTGGGGSIGSELCRQIAGYAPRQLIIFDIYENNAYDIQQELKRAHPELDLVVLIGSVRDRRRVEDVFRTYRPQLVYHAAAHKHVPLMEDSPCEAVKNNVFGTKNVAELADQYHVERFLLISSDKAVNPTNVMGATKRICEMVIQMIDRCSKTEYVSVRFGNVLGSNGSVIPLFKKQIAAGGPVTVTDPRIIRYFMTIPEAVSLVLQAGVYARGGEIFILDMGDPVKIDDLARNLIRLSGLEPDVDIPIRYTGLRPGEKLYEELLLSDEGKRKTENDLIYIGNDQPFDSEKLLAALVELEKDAAQDDRNIRRIISKIVPEYHPAVPVS